MTHLYTLGVIVASIFGALYQFYPMSLGAGARSIRVGVAGAWLLHTGVALLVTGFWFWRPGLQAAGWCALFLAIGCVSWNLLPQRRRMSQGRRAGAYVSAAHSMLGFALLLAGARIGASLGWWEIDRLGLIAAHFHLAAFGFAGLTAVGVGGRMIPMFLVAGPVPEWPLRVIGPGATLGLLTLAAGLLFGFPPAVWLGAVLGLASASAFVITIAGFFRRRLMRRLEPAFGHVLVAFFSLVLALAIGIGSASASRHVSSGMGDVCRTDPARLAGHFHHGDLVPALCLPYLAALLRSAWYAGASSGGTGPPPNRMGGARSVDRRRDSARGRDRRDIAGRRPYGGGGHSDGKPAYRSAVRPDIPRPGHSFTTNNQSQRVAMNFTVGSPFIHRGGFNLRRVARRVA